MRRRAFIGLVLALGAWASAACADPAPGADLALKDGRVLHHASILRDEGQSLVIRADEGLVKVSKDDLPDPVPGALPVKTADAPAPAEPVPLVMQPFNPDAAPSGQAPSPEPKKPAPRPTGPAPQKAKPAASLVYKGCSITSFQVKPYQGVQGCVEVVVSNPTNQIVILRPWDFVCVTAQGARHVGRNIITDGYPPHLKRREVVPQQGQIDDIVTFTDDALDNPTVQWAH